MKKGCDNFVIELIAKYDDTYVSCLYCDGNRLLCGALLSDSVASSRICCAWKRNHMKHGGCAAKTNEMKTLLKRNLVLKAELHLTVLWTKG